MMNILCWILGHKQSWTTMPDGKTRVTFMNFTQRDTAGERSRDVHMCERCHLLYWETRPLWTWKEGDPVENVGLINQMNKNTEGETDAMTGVELRAGLYGSNLPRSENPPLIAGKQ